MVYVPSLPGCISQGRTIQDAKKNIEEVISLRLEPLFDTVEILGNPATMHQIGKSERDIRNGKVKKILSVDDLLYECS